MQKIVCLPVKIYQYAISPLIGPRCRYFPSCSNYAIEAISHFGVVKGLLLSSRRILRCHPWSKGGYDPVLTHFKEKS
tara:strand:+ start:1742 stop:1972 length:231 start_codon:yes stop_codon:yes gene_type:complete